MAKKLLVFVFVVVLILSLHGDVFARSLVAPLPSSKPSPVPQAVNSFELFWPMVSGKTLGDQWYFLKTFKEKVRSALIFGKAEKADNYLFLATKRLLESEKLLTDKNVDLASKSLDNFLNDLELSLSNWEKAKTEESTTSSVKENINNRLNNIDILLKDLSTRYTGDVKGKISQGLEEVDIFLSSL